MDLASKTQILQGANRVLIINPYRELILGGLVGWWLHGKEDGTDASGYGRNGTVSGSPTWADFNGQRTINFDGSDDLISDCGSVSDFSFIHTTGVFSICFRAQWYADGTGARYFFGNTPASLEKGFFIGRESATGYGTNVMRSVVYGGTDGRYILFGTTNDNTAMAGANDHWCYVGNKPSNDTGTWYKNGSAVTTTTRYQAGEVSGTMAVTTGNATRTMRLGAVNYSSVLVPVKGYQADVRIYNRVLSADEIAAIAAGRG